MSKIQSLILDQTKDTTQSTLEIVLTTDRKIKTRATIPYTGKENVTTQQAHKYYAKKCIQEIIAPAISQLQIEKQENLDNLIAELTDIHLYDEIKYNLAFGISLAIAKATAQENHITLQQYLENTQQKEKRRDAHPPVLAWTILQKESIQTESIEYTLISNRAASVSQSIQTIKKIQHGLQKIVFSDMTTSETIEQIIKSIKEAGYTYNKDLFIGITIKNIPLAPTYHVTDLPYALSTNEYIEYYAQLCKTYDLLVCEDPFINQSKEVWQELHYKIREGTLLATSHNIKQVKKNNLSTVAPTTIALFNATLTTANSLTELSKNIEYAKLSDLKTMITIQKEEQKSMLALALAHQVDFIKIAYQDEASSMEIIENIKDTLKDQEA